MYELRCKDLNVEYKETQFQMFWGTVQKKCINRKLKLINCFLGPLCAKLIAKWLLNGQIVIAQLILRQNSIGDKGFQFLAPAVRNAQICYLDVTNNGLTAKSG